MSDGFGVYILNVDEFCYLCGHCVAICPAGAVLHLEMDMDNFNEMGEGYDVTTEQMISLIRRRRSHRSYSDKSVEREK